MQDVSFNLKHKIYGNVSAIDSVTAYRQPLALEKYLMAFFLCIAVLDILGHKAATNVVLHYEDDHKNPLHEHRILTFIASPHHLEFLV